jgi:hypothetical protein
MEDQTPANPCGAVTPGLHVLTRWRRASAKPTPNATFRIVGGTRFRAIHNAARRRTFAIDDELIPVRPAGRRPHGFAIDESAIS